MSSSDDQPSETRDRRLIREAKEEAFHARRALRQEMPSPSRETKRMLASALANYRDVLSDYQSERALETPWDERGVDVDKLDQWLAQTATVERSLPRRGSPVEEVTVPLVTQIPARTLFAVAKELDAIAKELGFAASPKQPTPSEEADMNDLRGLLRERGQTEALDNLPGGDVDE